MSEGNLSVNRRKRVNFIKGFLVTLFLIMLIIPIIVSAFAIGYVRRLDKKVDELSDRIDKLEISYVLKSEADKALDEMLIESKEQAVDEEELLADRQPEQIQTQSADDERIQTSKKIYLTFDDGPSSNTESILAVLDEYDVKATFFVTGAQAEKHPEWYKEIVDRGHTIGLHSYSHVYRDIYSSVDSFSADIEKLHDYIEDTTGVDTHVLRFPGGSSNRVSRVPMNDLCEWVHNRNWEYYDWNVSGQDATGASPGAAQITAYVLNGVKKHENCIVLMHDASGKDATVQALREIIEGIRKMDDTLILPIDEDTDTVQHLSPVYEDEQEVIE